MITDFSQTDGDIVRFAADLGLTDLNDLTISQVGADALVEFSGGSLLLQNVTATGLGLADFDFM